MDETVTIVQDNEFFLRAPDGSQLSVGGTPVNGSYRQQPNGSWYFTCSAYRSPTVQFSCSGTISNGPNAQAQADELLREAGRSAVKILTIAP